MATRSRARVELPRELDEAEYSSAMMSQPGVDDGDQYLFFTVPSRYGVDPAAGWTAVSSGKTKVWRCMDSGSGSISDGSTANGNQRVSREDRGVDGGVVNVQNRYHPTATDQFKSYDDQRRTYAPTTGRDRVETRLTSTGQSPPSPLSPSSSHLSPVSRPSAIPVRVATSGGMLCLSQCECSFSLFSLARISFGFASVKSLFTNFYS